MSGPMILLMFSLVACAWLHFTRPGSPAELAAAVLTIAPLLAIPVGWMMGTF